MGHGRAAAQAAGPLPSRDGQAPPHVATIAGHVAYAGGGGIAGAVVTAVETTTGAAKAVATDNAGAFTLAGVAVGRYVISATKDTYLSGQYGQQTPGGPRRALVLKDGETASVDITMWKAGVITGKVQTLDGQALPRVAVNLVRRYVDGDVSRLLPIRQSSIASDVGEYRIYGVEPGAYYVVAAPPPVTLNRGISRPTGYRSTFYPNATEPQLAQLVSVAADSTATAD